MTYDFERESHPRSEDIPLTPENQQLHQQFLTGLETVLSGDYARTVEITDTEDRGKWFSLPKERHIARVAFMRAKGIDESNVPFQVALQLNAHLLDTEVATRSADGISQLGYAWPDGVRATLIDNDFTNVSSWTMCFQPNAGKIFDTTGNKHGFIPTEEPDKDIIGRTYGITRDGASISDDSQDRLASFRIIAAILNEGDLDIEATGAFLEATATTDTFKRVPTGSTAHKNSQEYLDGLLHEAIHTPKLRHMLAWQQYWHGIDQSKI